jgi:hypothetical protein
MEVLRGWGACCAFAWSESEFSAVDPLKQVLRFSFDAEVREVLQHDMQSLLVVFERTEDAWKLLGEDVRVKRQPVRFSRTHVPLVLTCVQLRIVPSILLFRIAAADAERVRSAVSQAVCKVVSWCAEGEVVTAFVRMLSAVVPLSFPEGVQATPVALETLPEASVRLSTVSAGMLETMVDRRRSTLAEVLETVFGLFGAIICIVDAMISDASDPGCSVRVRMLTEQDADKLKGIRTELIISISEPSLA